MLLLMHEHSASNHYQTLPGAWSRSGGVDKLEIVVGKTEDASTNRKTRCKMILPLSARSSSNELVIGATAMAQNHY